MTKNDMIRHLVDLYRMGNRSDADNKPKDEAWTKPAMAGDAMCAKLDDIFGELVECGVLTADQKQEIYDDL